MSFYATIAGEVSYPNKDAFDSIVKQLQEKQFLSEDGYFLDELGEKISEDPDVLEEHLFIQVPIHHYRNLARFNFFSPDATGTIVWTSTDGCFQGEVIEDNKGTLYKLKEWAATNLEPDDQFSPERDDYSSDDDYYNALNQWQGMVEMEFHSDFC